MPIRILMLLVITGLVGCTTKVDNTVNFSGCWINEQFYHDIMVRKSPTHVHIPALSCIYVPKHTMMVTRMMGAGDVVLVKDKDTYAFWLGDLSKKIADVILLPGGRMKFNNNVFVKIPSHEEEIPSILETLLFNGHYYTPEGAAVEFTADNEVKGLPGLNYYSAMLDYAEVDTTVDRMWMGATLEAGTDFCYRFNADTLSIYKVSCKTYDSTIQSCVQLAPTTLAYKLIRTF